MICGENETKVTNYCRDVISGEIAAGSFVLAAVKRYLRDLDRQGTPGFPYHFNRNRANVACDFFPSVLRHSIGDAANLPFVLEPWQLFGIWNIFGWIRDDDETRRFRRVFWSMGRKNGKSTLCAGLALYMAALDLNPVTKTPESVAEVLLSATKRDQAAVIYGEVSRMREKSQHLESRSVEKHKQVTFNHNGGSIRTVSSYKEFNGLNPHLVVMDELHAWTHVHKEFYDTMLTGSGFRSQPLIISVTTAGDDKSHLWKDEHKYARGCATGRINDDSFFALSYEIDEDDDPLDPKNWAKANPNIGISLKPNYLEEQARYAKESNLNTNRFTRYHCNRLVSSTESAFNLKDWDACAGELSDWTEADAIGAGVDLGSRDDLAAIAFVARFPTGQFDDDDKTVWRYEVRTFAYIADDTVRDLSKPPFAQWVHEDLIRRRKYPISELKSELIEQCRNLRVASVAYDPYNAQPMAESIEQQGIEIASMTQNASHFNEPIQELRSVLSDGRFRHNGNEMLRWCVSNAIAISDRQDRWMLAKRDSADKIDPVVAMLMALKRCSMAPSKPKGPLACF